jgi:multiple sugar transport system ATP-binding protein
VARVVLENVYKSFQRRPGEQMGRFAAIPLPTPVTPEQLSTTPSTTISVLRHINLTVHDGEFLVLVGPSGCGKSTLLRLIAGLEQLTGGNIWVGDRLVNNLPPKQRDIAMVFQNYALYPHMTVYENLAFGLRRTGLGNGDWGMGTGENSQVTISSKKDSPLWNREDLLVSLTRPLPKELRYWSAKERVIDERVRIVAKMLQIEELLERLPRQLSGGQKQRVALGRAMARNPQVFLMDEPLSNLDAKLRIETRAQIVNLQRKLGITTIYVTHDQTEAMTMGDRIAVMNAGQIQQIASPLELYNHPANRFVAEFIGSPPMNFLPVQVKAPLLITYSQFRLTLPQAWETALQNYGGQTVTLGIRPEHLSVSVPAPKNLPVQVERVEALGSDTYLSVRLIPANSTSENSLPLQARIEPDRTITPGESLWLSLAVDKIHLFEAKTGMAIATKTS